MTITATPLASQAEALLAKNFARLREATAKTAIFCTIDGSHLALTRTAVNDIYLWAERSPESMEGVMVKNRDYPGLPYSPDQPRAHSINRSSDKLGFGNQAYYLKCETLGALERFIGWYSKV